MKSKLIMSVLVLLLSVPAFAQSSSLNFVQSTYSSDYVFTPSFTALDVRQALTMEAWIKWSGKPGYLGMVSKPSDTSTTGYTLGLNDGNPVFALSTIGENRVLFSNTSLTADSWTHVAGTYDGTTVKIYINGVLDDSFSFPDTSTINFSADNGLLVGVEFVAGAESFLLERDFTGNIDEVRIWNVPRTAAQIFSTYDTELNSDYYSSSDSGLVLYYQFNEGSGSTVTDLSVNAADGTISNATFQDDQQATLPVELASFSAQPRTNGVVLNWSTATETNNSGWEIESRGTGNKEEGTWSKIGFVAGKGTTTEKQTYSFSVSSLQSAVSQHKFRLKQIDTDGKFNYSNVLTVSLTPETYSLSQNYPNPFNPTTQISYNLKSNSFVSLKVFDLLGREVKTLVNEEKSAGSFSVNFSAVDLPSGVYFYKLTAGSFSETRKMTVMK